MTDFDVFDPEFDSYEELAESVSSRKTANLQSLVFAKGEKDWSEMKSHSNEVVDSLLSELEEQDSWTNGKAHDFNLNPGQSFYEEAVDSLLSEMEELESNKNNVKPAVLRESEDSFEFE